MKVAAYCRVSTDKNDQVNSLEHQKRYFNEYINKNPSWSLIKVYVDEGITGTNIKKRHSFKQMIMDAQNHKFDLIITKEISRFARNTLDSIYYTRKLKDLGIGVLFLNDNINTKDPDSELRLTIMSSIAQEESRKTSERVKWGQKRSMEQGVVFGRDLLGYDVRDGKLTINEEGAKIVQLIYKKFVIEGKGTLKIAKELELAGIKTVRNKKNWHNAVVLKILRNEKYCGDLIQKKTYTPNYLNHEKKQNNGEEEYVILKNHHAPIISRELFLQAQKELGKRSQSIETKKKYSNRYWLSGKIKCESCKSSYVARTRKYSDGTTIRTWRCYEAVKHGSKVGKIQGVFHGCSNKSIKEEEVKDILIKVVTQQIQQLDSRKEEIIHSLIKVISAVTNTKESDSIVEKYHDKVTVLSLKNSKLLDLYLDNKITKVEFLKRRSQLELEISQTQQLIEDNSFDSNGSKEDNNMINDVENFIRGIINGEKWNDTFYKEMVECIKVKIDKVEIKIKYIQTPFTITRT